MEVLNQNQRRSAIWRITGLGIFILALVATILFSMQNAYASTGVDEYEELLEKYAKDQKVWEGKNQQLQNTINKLKKDLKTCREDGSKPNEALRQCEERMKLKDDRIKILDADLLRCETKLAACSSY